MKILVAAAAAGMLFTGSAALALTQDGDDYSFQLTNRSPVAITQFNTKRSNGSWSSNWLRTQVAPGQVRAMRFNTGDDRCEVVTRVTFADESYFEDTVNYCGANAISVTDDTMTVR